ncbi:IS3 family transposase [Pseudonocardia sulfidoxydans]|uniref:IS3 family transposase n=1 Tax=Pseudonocardia sulfidoxydans TaxID=54011 RepID=UPI00361F1098
MGAPRKFDEETRARAVRLYQDRLRDHGESKLAARRHVGELLDVNPATIRNWIEAEERSSGFRSGSSGNDDDTAAELRKLRAENAELRRANEILKTASAFFGSGGAGPSTQVRLLFVHEHRSRFGVEPICAVLSEHGVQVAPQTYYRWRARPVTDRQLDEAYLVNRIVDIYRKNRCVYGVRKMWRAARREGLRIGRDQMGRLMRVAGIQGVRRGVHHTTTTTRDQRAARHPDLVKRAWAAPTRPDALWVADFTYVWTASGFCYVSFVTDVYSRRILGWKASMSKTTDLVSGALAQALSTRQRAISEFTAEGLIHHSDAGSQYTSLAFTEQLAEAGIAGSIGTVGDALDNALMESTIGLCKSELITQSVHSRNWNGLREVERETAEWVHWYNSARLHSSIDYLPPIEREMVYATSIAQQGAVA